MPLVVNNLDENSICTLGVRRVIEWHNTPAHNFYFSSGKVHRTPKWWHCEQRWEQNWKELCPNTKSGDTENRDGNWNDMESRKCTDIIKVMTLRTDLETLRTKICQNTKAGDTENRTGNWSSGNADRLEKWRETLRTQICPNTKSEDTDNTDLSEHQIWGHWKQNWKLESRKCTEIRKVKTDRREREQGIIYNPGKAQKHQSADK